MSAQALIQNFKLIQPYCTADTAPNEEDTTDVLFGWFTNMRVYLRGLLMIRG